VKSSSYPILIHYRNEVEKSIADEVLKAMEHSWQVETEKLKFLPPIPDPGKCGPDGGFDVFLWRTYRAGGVEVLDVNPETTWDDYYSYMVIDPWGPYGGIHLNALIAHELNHGMQAAYDWWESGIFFEMTSQFIEDEVYDDDNGYKEYLFDFQGNPDWAFDFYDDYETWYMYGSMLYLQFLRDSIYEGDSSLVSEIWDRSRNPAGENEPDFEDALNAMLDEKAGISFEESLIRFCRWRYYTGERDDGKHFEEGATFPPEALVKIEQSVHIGNDVKITITPGPMLLGVQYIELTRESTDPALITVQFDGNTNVRWVVQVVPALSETDDGETLDLSTGSATLGFGTLNKRTLVILALPIGEDDPDDRTDTRYGYSITLKIP
jgi:hypothetical protein